jgi:polyisoprenoid-binding protein YceI
VKRVLIAVAVVVILGVGAIGAYLVFFDDDAPERLTFTDDTTNGTDAPDGSDEPEGSGTTAPAESLAVDGTWEVGEGTQVGYRVVEDFIGGLQDNEAVGRTPDVTGSLTIEGTTVPAAEFVADLTTLESDEPRRDGQVQGRILETAEFPDATFTLTAPIDFGSVPAAGQEVAAQATGELQLHGVTQEVTFAGRGKVVDDHIEILGEIPIVFADYEIANPSNALISTEEEGLLEFLLVLEKAA